MMKRLAIVSCLAAVVALAGCGSDNSTSPSTTTVFTVTLLPANEVPPIPDQSEAGGRGTGVITVHSDSNTIDFAFNMTGFPNDTVITNAHIHPGASGVAGGVKVAAGVSSTIPLTNGSGTFNNTVTTTAQNVTDVLGAPQNFYFNIHSAKNPGGVARGQLR